MSRIVAWCVFVLAVLATSSARADLSVTLTATKDATIYSTLTSNVSGFSIQLMAGRVGVAGSCAANSICGATERSLVQFNLTSIPPGSDVTNADLRLYQVGSTSTVGSATITASRVTGATFWGENGTPNPNDATQAAIGRSSFLDGVSWRRRRENSSGTAWSLAGGDFLGASASVSTAIGGDTTTPILRTFSSTAMNNDAEFFVDNPSFNYGWIIRGNEGVENTMRRFASRNNTGMPCGAGCRPQLFVQYELPLGQVCSVNGDCDSDRCVATANPGIKVCCSAPSCSSGGQCFGAGYCQAGSGTCTSDPLSNGTLCADPNPGNVCSRGECNGGGACVERADPGSGGTICRASTGTCDPQEVCTGSSASCPGNVVLGNGTPCPTGADSNPCTQDICNGVSGPCTHPAGNPGTLCRASAGICDIAETCDGVSTTCPANGFQPPTTQCAGPSCVNATTFQPPTLCNGSMASCPAAPPPTSCAPFTCSGSSCTGGCTDDTDCSAGNYCAAPNCLPKKSNGTACTASNECITNQCADGVCCNTNCGGSNPNDCQSCATPNAGTCTPLPASTACRASAGTCDIAEVCNGVSTACPGDSFLPASTVCRAGMCSAGSSTVEANCPGTGPTCPSEQIINCAPFACNGPLCHTSCTNDNQCLVGNYCANGSCVPQKVNGISCGASNECVNGFCVDGVCCNNGCLGQCEACDINPGTCNPVVGDPRGTRPLCSTDGSLCGGQCNGVVTTGCTFPGAAIECRAASCDSGVATVRAVCDGTGNCPAEQTMACDPFVCSTTACFGTCVVDSQCNDSSFCMGGNCVPEFPNGDACGSPNQCASGLCVDGVCCDGLCTGQCEACDVSSFEGACTPVLGDPRGGRPLCATDGSLCGGTCDGTTVVSCVYPTTGSVCRDASCASDQAILGAFCDGQGACPPEIRQDCSGAGCSGDLCAGGCVVDPDCLVGEFCSGGVCLPQGALGDPCAAGSQCVSGACTDGFCCSRACTGQCEACNVPGNEGACTSVVGAPVGTRPPCATDASACAGACDGGLGTACTYPGQSTQCRAPACSAGVATLAANCIGSGACPGTQTQVCPGSCGGNLCAGGCTTDANCAAGEFCSGGVCLPKKLISEACSGPSQCLSGFCIDGFCCDTDCTGQCEACDVQGSLGFCSTVMGAPHGGRGACVGFGPCAANCTGASNLSCSSPDSTTVCGVGSCTGGVATNPPTCNGAGTCLEPTVSSCAPFLFCDGEACATTCTDSTECAAGFECLGGSCELPGPDGGAGAAGMGGMTGAGGATMMDGGATGGSAGTMATGGTGGGGTGGTGGGTSAGGSAGTVSDAGPDGGTGSDPEKTGGCSCRAAGSESAHAWWLAPLAAIMVARRRRRRAA